MLHISTALDEGFIVLGIGFTPHTKHAHSCFKTIEDITLSDLKSLYKKYCPDLWTILQEDTCSQNESSIHTLFTAGNGRIGLRGTIPELLSGDSQGIYMAGFFDKMTRAPIDTKL